MPDKIGKHEVSTACEIHDGLYSKIEIDFEKSKISYIDYKAKRKEADKLFLKDLKYLLPWYFWFVAYFYYFGVRLFGTPQRVKIIRKLFGI